MIVVCLIGYLLFIERVVSVERILRGTQLTFIKSIRRLAVLYQLTRRYGIDERIFIFSYTLLLYMITVLILFALWLALFITYILNTLLILSTKYSRLSLIVTTRLSFIGTLTIHTYFIFSTRSAIIRRSYWILLLLFTSIIYAFLIHSLVTILFECLTWVTFGLFFTYISIVFPCTVLIHWTITFGIFVTLLSCTIFIFFPTSTVYEDFWIYCHCSTIIKCSCNHSELILTFELYQRSEICVSEIVLFECTVNNSLIFSIIDMGEFHSSTISGVVDIYYGLIGKLYLSLLL